MTNSLVSFASVFTKDNDPDPLCSICFFVTPSVWMSAGAALHHLAHKIVPELAQIVPNSNADTLSFAIRDRMNEMKEEFGVECRGVLTDYNLSICTKE